MGESVDDESYTENTLRTVEIDDLSDPSRKDNKMSIDGIESANPYPLYSHSGDDGTWLQFALGFFVVLLLGIVGVICACIFHAQMRKKGWMGILFGLLNKIVFAFVVQWYVKELSVWQFGCILFL